MLARPETVVEMQEMNDTPFVRVTPSHGMFYPSIVHFRKMVYKALVVAEFKAHVVIDCEKFAGLDYTAAQVDWSMCPFSISVIHLLIISGYLWACQ